MINRWGVDIRRGFTVQGRGGRNGTEGFSGRVVGIDSRSNYARAYGPLVTLQILQPEIVGKNLEANQCMVSADSIASSKPPEKRTVKPRNRGPLGMIEWQTRVADCFSCARSFKSTSEELRAKLDQFVYSELNRKWGNRSIYSAFMQGYVRGLIHSEDSRLMREDVEFCYLQGGVIFSTHRTTVHRTTEEFYSAGRGCELGALPRGFYWKGTDKPFTLPTLASEQGAAK